MEHWELVARECIRDLVARYNSNGDSGRFAAVIDLFCDGATFEVPGASYRGRDEILRMFEAAAARTGSAAQTSATYIRHFTATHQIDVETENEARGRCYYAVLTERGLDHWGRYVDRYARDDAWRWRFAARVVSVDGAVPGGWGAAGSAGEQT